MAQVASRIFAQRDSDSSERSKNICRLQSMKRIFKFKRGWSTANCNERDERTFKFEKRWSSANCNERDEKNGSVDDEIFSKKLWRCSMYAEAEMSNSVKGKQCPL